MISMIAVAAALAACIAAAVASVLLFLSRRRFLSRLRETAGAGKEGLAAFRARYPDAALLRRSGAIEKLAGSDASLAAVPRRIGVTRLWVGRLSRKMNAGDFRRVLAFGGGEDLWPCFLQALAQPRQGERFLAWFEGKDAFFSLREMARAGGGADFDGTRARELLSASLDRVRELTGDPDWRVRRFAAAVILGDDHPLSREALWAALGDGAFQVRALVVPAFVPDDAERFYAALYDLVLRDPVFAVRSAARKRIQKDFPDRYRPDPSALPSHEALHVLDLLAPGSEADRDLAYAALGGDKIELRAVAARYLQREGELERLLSAAELGDRVDFARRVSFLSRAAEADVLDFFHAARELSGAGPVLAALTLLRSYGPRSLIRTLAEKALHGFAGSEHEAELRAAALSCVEARGEEDALRLLFKEILARRTDAEAADEFLRRVPARGEELFSEVALELLSDPRFAARDGLVSLLARLPERSTVPRLIDLVQDVEGVHPRTVRVDALRALAAMDRPYLLDFALEHFYLLSPEPARTLAASLSKAHGKAFDEAAARLVGGPDASVRAAVLGALAATGKKDFLKLVRPAVDDADPEARAAAIRALVEFGDAKSLKGAMDRLRDPIEEVRVAAAAAVAEAGSDELLAELRKTLDDENEADAVKEAAIAGLGAAGRVAAVDLLIDALDRLPALAEPLLDALARKTAAAELSRVVERFKDASPELRERLTFAFRRMGEAGQEALLALLGEEIGSLRPFIAAALEETGFVEAAIRRLSHRETAVRRDAAAALSLIGTDAAFRGVVQAARDPDQDVRVRVVKALERLDSEEGTELLRSLREDPDRRVRKYTEWALERLRAKTL